MSYGNTEDIPSSSYPLCYFSSACQCASVFVWAFIIADWIKVSGAVKTTDLFIRISGYLLRQAQAMIPTVALKTILREALKNCN